MRQLSESMKADFKRSTEINCDRPLTSTEQYFGLFFKSETDHWMALARDSALYHNEQKLTQERCQVDGYAESGTVSRVRWCSHTMVIVIGYSIANTMLGQRQCCHPKCLMDSAITNRSHERTIL
eukprot:scpid111603/ scgid8446/ 